MTGLTTAQDENSADAVATPTEEFRSLRDLRGSLGWHVGAATRAILIFLVCLLGAGVQGLMLRLRPTAWNRVPRLISRIVAHLVGLRVRVEGQPTGEPALLVSNHVSWLDIPLLGANTSASFVAKKEVAGWGGFGLMARLYCCVFVDRTRRNSAGAQLDAIAARLEKGDSLILFAEGTSSDGRTVLPFKSALFGTARQLPDLRVQPVTIAYTHINGLPMTRAMRPLIGWFGDMELTSHVWQALTLGRIGAVLKFHAPVTLNETGSRKALAAQCHAACKSGLEDIHYRQLPDPAS